MVERKKPVDNSRAKARHEYDASADDKLLEENIKLKADLASASASNEQIDKLMDMNHQLAAQNEQLMAALVASKEVVEPTTAIEQTYSVVNTCGSAVSATVTDDRGMKRLYQWPDRGSSHELTADQIQEIRDIADTHFTNGYLSCSDLIPDTPNHIHSVKKFLNDLTYETVNERIEAITSVDTLYSIFNYIEFQAFEEKAIIDKNGHQVLPRKQLKPLYVSTQVAVRNRLSVLANVTASLDGGE